MGRIHINRRHLLASATAAGAAAVLPGRARAQNAKVLEVANLSGPDRARKILEGAKSEGRLTLYSVAPPSDNSALTGPFEKKYGIKVNLYRASSEELRQRMLNEARARRFDVDLILNNSPALDALTGENVLQEVKSPHIADMMPDAQPPHRAWAGFCLNVLLAAYNTNLVKKADLPKTYADLLDPKWKGKIAIEADDSDWFAGLMAVMGEEKGLKLFRDIATTNGFSVRKGHTLMTNMVSAGELAMALTVFNYTAEQFKKKGAPLDWFVIDPLISMPNGIALAANAPHPNAAVLFFDFLLSDAQPILAARDYVVTNITVASPIDRARIHVMDAAKVLAAGDKWQKLYTQVITARK